MDEGTTFDTDGGFAAPEKVLSINFNKAKTKFCWVYITIIAIVICFSMEKKSFKFRGNNRNVSFLTQLCYSF